MEMEKRKLFPRGVKFDAVEVFYELFIPGE